jgi:group II intron reverse transcriptase/maturase
MDWMREAFRLTRKDGAPGIDGATAEDYERNLEANLLDLLERIKSGRYRAPPVRRAYIPKADGTQRMLGIPTFEDKVAQRAVTMLLEAVYEQDFLPCSYGFRPGRSAHDALRTLQNVLWAKRLHWVVDIDIRKYFDSIPHSHLRVFLDRRVTDGVIRRMIDKWLNAGAVEDGLLHRATEGSPQGGVISPCLSNVFLHYVLDEWFETEVKRSWRSTISSTPSAFWRSWVSVSKGLGSRCIPTRRASSTSAHECQKASAIPKRMGPTSTS